MTKAQSPDIEEKNPGSKLKQRLLVKSNQDQKLRRDVSPSAREAPVK